MSSFVALHSSSNDAATLLELAVLALGDPLPTPLPVHLPPPAPPLASAVGQFLTTPTCIDHFSCIYRSPKYFT